jgi:TonB family protein
MLVSIVVMCLFGLTLSSIEIPEIDRKESSNIPERIANLILEKEKAKPIVTPKEKPKPKPKPKPEPIEKNKVRIKKKQDKPEPLSQVQKQARERAQESGLLALSNELADLIDTSTIDSMVATNLTNDSSSVAKSRGSNKDILTAGINEGSGGVNSEKFNKLVSSNTSLSAQDVVAINQKLISEPEQVKKNAKDAQRASGNLREEQEVVLVFDQNKGKLYSIYNRERRKNPSLKGKIVFEITIAPQGKVTSVEIVSSELNLPKLEKSLLARIKLFKFSADKSEPITVIFPLEFLPS